MHYGNLVFVTDPDLVLNRPGENASRGRATPPDPVDLITDPKLLGVWLAALDQLAAAPLERDIAPRYRLGRAARGEGNRPPGRRAKIDTDEDRWLAYADNAQSQMGSAMFRFALGGFPALRAVPPTAGADLKEPTDRVIDERAPGLKGDDSETVNEDVDPRGR